MGLMGQLEVWQRKRSNSALDYDWFELETFLFYFIFSCISYRDLDIRGDTVKIQTDVIACCCMSTVLIVSNSTAKTWFVGFPSLVSLRSPKYWPEPAPGRFGVGDSVKVKPKPPPLLELEGTKVKTKEVLNEQTFE